MEPWLLPALDDAAALRERLEGRELEVAFVTCSYDTSFEPVSEQVRRKVEELLLVFPEGGPVKLSLLVVNDAPRVESDAFARAVLEGFSRCPPRLADEGRLRLVPLSTTGQGPFGRKGRALREGMRLALERGADVVVYVNLNLKAHAAQAATGLRTLLDECLDAAVGSRARKDGGAQLGAGALGALKSRAYNRLTRAALPPLEGFLDTTGPMKVLRRRAAAVVVDRARIDGAGFDGEWLCVLWAHGLRAGRFPLRWVQRRGSRPPWALVGRMVLELARLRRALLAGRLGPRVP